MRISGGFLKGRTLAAGPDGALRPTQDAVREAVFSMLASVVPGCGFLDLYAGTGAVGLEAWSRGAARVTWVENSPRSLRVLERNAAACVSGPLPPQLRIARAPVEAWLKRPALPPESVDVVFADPPYVAREGEPDGMGALAAALAESGILAPRSFFAAEQRDKTPPPVAPGWETIALRRYGRTQVALLRREIRQSAG